MGGQYGEEIYPNLELEEDIFFWMIGIIIGRILLWITIRTRLRLIKIMLEVYMKWKEESIKRNF